MRFAPKDDVKWLEKTLAIKTTRMLRHTGRSVNDSPHLLCVDETPEMRDVQYLKGIS
jgi:hypothetical protein